MKLLIGIPLLFTLTGCVADPYYDDPYSYTQTTQTTRTQYIPTGSSMIYTETVVQPAVYYRESYPVYVYPRNDYRPAYRPYYHDRRPDYRPRHRPDHDGRPWNDGRPGRPDHNGPRPGNDHHGRPDRPR